MLNATLRNSSVREPRMRKSADSPGIPHTRRFWVSTVSGKCKSVQRSGFDSGIRNSTAVHGTLCHCSILFLGHFVLRYYVGASSRRLWPSGSVCRHRRRVRLPATGRRGSNCQPEPRLAQKGGWTKFSPAHRRPQRSFDSHASPGRLPVSWTANTDGRMPQMTPYA